MQLTPTIFFLALAVAARAADAPDPMSTELWSLKPFAVQPVPAVQRTEWPVGRLDHFILARLEREGLTPNPDADAPTLLRRLSYDLIGLPPSLEEIEAFTPSAIEQTVDRLLASPDFGARWGRHWLDVARYAESSGNTRNMAYVEAWRYRNYVVRAFNRNVPFDQFIREQLAGDLLPAAKPEQRDEQLLATGFLTIGTKSLGEQDLTSYELNIADDQIDATCHAFLALSANCARCHNHKFDPIPARDYYALAGIFRSTRHLSAVETNNRKEEAEGMPLGANARERLETAKRYDKELAESQKEYEAVAKRRTALREELAKAGADVVAEKKAELGALDKSVEEWKTRLKAMRESAPKPPEVGMAVQDKAQAADCPLYAKGNPKRPEDAVPRGGLSAVPVKLAPIAPHESGRLQLADWIASPENPLTARVIVNRVWQHLFGRGLVETPDDFGRQGTRPSHPELLDDLAARFVRDGWNVKALIREFALSRTYRLSSESRETTDAANVLLWRAHRQQLEAEPLRDTFLLLGGALRREMLEGSPVKDLAQNVKPQSREFGRNGYLKDLADTGTHRSVYLPTLRGFTLPLQQCFDGADPGCVVGARRSSIVPSQALFLMNSDFAMQHAEGFARQVLALPAAAVEERIAAMWRLAFTRPPTQNETAKVATFLDADATSLEAWSRAAHVLMMTAEFRTLY